MAVLNKLQKGQAITSDILNNIIDGIRECQLQSVVGGYFRRGTGGTTITIANTRTAGGQICPFTPTVTAVTSGFDVSFSVGTINGILPTNMFSNITGVTTQARNYFYIKCDTDGKLITTAVIEKDTEVRTPQVSVPDAAPDELNILIATMATSGAISTAIACENLSVRAVPNIQEDNVTYVAGERNFTQYYNWVI